MSPQIGIVLGSYSDVKLMKSGLERLRAMQVPFEMCIASAHRTPEKLEAWLDESAARGVRVIVAGAGAAAHLPGVVASKTLLPVVGIPFDATPLRGEDALFSIVQMPPGIPVATVGINSSENAVVLALQILALNDVSIGEKLREYRRAWKDKIEEQNQKLYEEYPEARPAEWESSEGFVLDEVIEEDTVTRRGAPSAAPAVKKKSAAVRKRVVNPDSPDLGAIEEAVDVLLDGGVVGLPTDTVYGVAADATNQRAVQGLYMAKDRDPKKPIPVLVDSVKMFRQLVQDVPDEVDEVIDRFWPGALTIVARRRTGTLESAVVGETIGIRMPDNMITLSVISMLARPLATTSANISGTSPANTASDVARQIGEYVDLIIDGGASPGGSVSTVLDVVEKPFRILREGAVTRQMLKDALGDLVA